MVKKRVQRNAIHDVIKEEEQYRKFVAAYRGIVAAIEGQQSQRNSAQHFLAVCMMIFQQIEC